MRNDTVSTEPVTKPYQYIACTKRGRIIATMQNFPPAELQDKEFEITQEEFYFLRTLLLSRYNNLRSVHRMTQRLIQKQRSVR